MARFLAKYGVPWPYVTRTIGAIMVGFGMFIDHSSERGTIILAGVGFLGYEFVQKSEPKGAPERKELPEDGTE